jgi:hypothetical protein
MAQQTESKEVRLTTRGQVQLPAAVIDMSHLKGGKLGGSMMKVYYGRNFRCAIIVPSGTVLKNDMQERIYILTNEKLD